MPLYILLVFIASLLPAQELRLVRSLSGPSGTLAGNEFVIEAPRSRFVYPQDASLVVYFEWTAAPGNYALTAQWRQPDGRVAAISPDVRMAITTNGLKCYWTYNIAPDLQPGVWVAEVRINGSPAGSHSFEVVGTSPAPDVQLTQPVAASSPAPPPSLDTIYRSVSGSVASVHKVDATGRRVDSGTGFVLDKDQVATAFQIIDGAASLQVEFPDGTIASTDVVLAFSRLGDWAVLRANTGGRVPLARDPAERLSVGADAIVFNVSVEQRVIGGINIAGQTDVAGFGPRIHLSQTLGVHAIGGPLLSRAGLVAGIVGGSMIPGARSNQESGRQLLVPWSPSELQTLAVPIRMIPNELTGSGSTTARLLADRVFTPTVIAMPEILFAGTAAAMSKKAQDPLPATVSEFSRKDPELWIFSLWKRQAKLSKGTFAARFYDASNKALLATVPQKLSFSSQSTRVGVAIPPEKLPAGVVRIDLLFDSRPVWRMFVRLRD